MTEKQRELIQDGPIVFYDGECGLCDLSVQRLVKMDKRRRLRFATLQGETALAAIGAPEGPQDNWTVKLLDENGVHERSSAALRATAHAGGIWKLAMVLLVIPRALRDGVYRWVARNRKKWFEKKDSCTIPTPALRERFLP